MMRSLWLLILIVALVTVTTVTARVDTQPATAVTTQHGDCKQKVQELGMVDLAGHYYYFSDANRTLNWNDAQQFCKSHGLELVSIQHSAKNTRIIVHILGIRAERYINGMWTSGARAANNTWSWTGTSRPVEFSAWYDKHPLSDTTKNKIAIAGFRTKVRWISLSDNEERRFICEFTQPCTTTRTHA